MDLNIIITEVTYTLTILVVNTPDLILTPPFFPSKWTKDLDTTDAGVLFPFKRKKKKNVS